MGSVAWGTSFNGMGCRMKSYKAFLFLTLVACLSTASCYHEFPGGGGGGGGTGGGSGNVSLVLVSDTLPANIGIISFKVAISSVVLTSSTNTVSTLNLGGLNNGAGLIVDLARAQSDSIFLGTITGVPSGTNSSITVHFSGAQIAFFNGTGAAITNLSPQCPAASVCVATFNTSGTPIITSSQAITGNTGFGIDFNLANAITLSGTTLSLNLTNSGTTNVISSFALPRNQNLSAGQLDLIEDFTGIATVTGSSVKIVSPAASGRGTITASSNANTVYDFDPSQALCNGATSLATCLTTTNEAASMDAILNADGTFTVQEIEPLLASPVVDTVEGTVVSIASQTQFSLITSDIIPAATNSKITGLNLGDPLTVNLGIIAGSGFQTDTKGFPVGGALGAFQNKTDTTAIHLGQAVSVHVNSFTAANGTTAAIANNVDAVTLRWSRFIAPTAGATTPTLFNVNNLPAYFGFGNPVAEFQAQIFTGAIGADGVTNLDGISNGGTVLVPTPPVGIRALFLEDTGNSFTPAFFAAKVRQH